MWPPKKKSLEKGFDTEFLTSIVMNARKWHLSLSLRTCVDHCVFHCAHKSENDEKESFGAWGGCECSLSLEITV